MDTAVVRRGTPGYAIDMAAPDDRSTDVSVRQFVADSGSVTRGLRQGRSYTLTLNGEPLARMIPIRRRRAVPKEEVLGIFAMQMSCAPIWTMPWTRKSGTPSRGPGCDTA